MPNYFDIFNVHLSEAVCNGECSSTFSVSNSVKQGGVLSPVLFTVYLDGLIDQLRKKGLGCHFNGHFDG